MKKTSLNKNELELLAEFVDEVTQSLLEGKRYKIDGFGTFSTCSRKATSERAACRIAMFRASSELRESFSGAPLLKVSGDHELAIGMIIQAMVNEVGIEISNFGRFAAESVKNNKTKITFHGDKKLNSVLN